MVVIYGKDAAKMKAEAKNLPEKTKYTFKSSARFQGVVECEQAIVTCGDKEIIAAYGDKVKLPKQVKTVMETKEAKNAKKESK